MEVHPQLTEVAMVVVTVEATEILRDRVANPPGGSFPWCSRAGPSSNLPRFGKGFQGQGLGQ